MAISIETIELVKTKLKAVPPKPRTEVESKKEAVLMLRAEIEKLRRDGYDWNDVAALIADDGQGGGIEVKGSSIKAFLSTPRTGGARRKKATADAGENWPKV